MELTRDAVDYRAESGDGVARGITGGGERAA
jgi:hypothetical protein